MTRVRGQSVIFGFHFWGHMWSMAVVMAWSYPFVCLINGMRVRPARWAWLPLVAGWHAVTASFVTLSLVSFFRLRFLLPLTLDPSYTVSFISFNYFIMMPPAASRVSLLLF